MLEFHKIIAPLIALSKEAHTALYLPDHINKAIKENATFLPLMMKFLGTELYATEDLTYTSEDLKFRKIKSINGETPGEIVSKFGTLFASDGNIQLSKYYYLDDFNLSRNYYYYYGEVDSFEVEFEGYDVPVHLEPLTLPTINSNIEARYGDKDQWSTSNFTPLQLQLLGDSIAVLEVNTFSNSQIRAYSKHGTLKNFLKKSFRTIREKEIETLIIDISQNDGGNEGNEGLLFSYIGENYQKYRAVKAKTQKAILDNGVDKQITLKTYGLLEKFFTTKTLEDGSLIRRNGIFGPGLMAFSKDPKYKFRGKNIFIIIGPGTYSGGRNSQVWPSRRT